MSTTPRTDAARGFHDMDTAVSAEDMAQLETELTEAKANFKEERTFLIAEIKELNAEVERLKKDTSDMGTWVGSKMLQPEWDSFKQSLEVIEYWKTRAELAEASAKLWEADALRYANNTEFWKDRAEKAEAEVEQLTKHCRALQVEVAVLSEGLSEDHAIYVATARAEKAEAELKEMQSSALTWARFSGEKASCADLAEQRLEKAESELARLRAQEGDYIKTIAEVLKCEQRSACEQPDDQLEAPWEVVARLRADLERFTGHGLLDCHAICDQRDAALAERDRLREELAVANNWAEHHAARGNDLIAENINHAEAAIRSERLWKEFITLMDITEESDSGNAFNPNKISSCRAMDGKRLNEILNEARQIVFKQ